MIATAVIGTTGALLLLIGLFIVSFIIVKVTDWDMDKAKSKAMKAPIAKINEMGLSLGEWDKKHEILVEGKNYSFVLKYNPAKYQYLAHVYDNEEGHYCFTISSTDYDNVVESAKCIVEKLEKLELPYD